MTKDKELEKLFSSALTEFDDNETFLSRLEQKLEKVEYMKRIQEEQKKSYRINLVLAFVAGALSLLAVSALFPALPTDQQILQAVTDINLSLPVKGKLLSITLTVALTYCFVFSIRSIRQDISAARKL